MNRKSNESFSLLKLILNVILLSAISAGAYTAVYGSFDKPLQLDINYIPQSTNAQLEPWNLIDDNSYLLSESADHEIINADYLNEFTRELLINSATGSDAVNVINSTDFYGDTMITPDFDLWVKDKTITTQSGEEYCIGYYIFIGRDYTTARSAYCIRTGALSKDNVWNEFSHSELLGSFNINSVSYMDGPVESEFSEDGAEQYIRVNEAVYTNDGELFSIVMPYIRGIMDLSGFESLGNEYVTSFVESLLKNDVKLYHNGDLAVISFNNTLPFNLHLLYDLETCTFCGWVRQ